MARVFLKPDSPIQSLSGTVGNITFRTMNGKTFMLSHAEPELHKDASLKEKAQYKRRMMVNACVRILQASMPMLEAMQERKKMYDRLKVLYDKYAHEIKAPTKLQKKIMTEYYARFNTDKTSTKPAQNTDEVSKL